MSTFYLMDNGNRFVIDAETGHGKVEKSVEASCWIAAKKAFGFELTPVQDEMLKSGSAN